MWWKFILQLEENGLLASLQGICKNPKNDLLLKNDRFFSTKKTLAISTKHLLVGSGSKASDVLMAVEELERELAQEIVFFVDAQALEN